MERLMNIYKDQDKKEAEERVVLHCFKQDQEGTSFALVEMEDGSLEDISINYIKFIKRNELFRTKSESRLKTFKAQILFWIIAIMAVIISHLLFP